MELEGANLGSLERQKAMPIGTNIVNTANIPQPTSNQSSASQLKESVKVTTNDPTIDEHTKSK